MSWTERIMVLLAVFISLAIGYGLIDQMYHHYQEEHTKVEVEGWEPPVIPQCNKELWDRIREGCD